MDQDKALASKKHVQAFTCVFNRARDSYQVPLGLFEGGLLDVLVTDFYASIAARSFLPRALASKHHIDLPSELTKSDRLAFLVQYAAQLIKLPMTGVFSWVDRRLAHVAGKRAQKAGAHLYCYHNYVPSDVADDCCLIVFVFHPLESQFEALFAADLDDHPEVRAAFSQQQSSVSDPKMPVPWSRADAIVCASRVTARSLIYAGAPPDRITVIPYGLPTGLSPCASSFTTGRDARFLFVGNGLQRKGIHHLLKAWRLKAREGAKLTVVSYDLDPTVAAIAADDPSVTITGYQTKDELETLFARSDVFIMPSLLEGFGLVYLEALAAGCHVIATPNTGLPDLHLSKGAATLVSPGNLAEISTAIDTAIAKVASGGFDRDAIAAEGRRWRQADFRKAIANHAKAVLAWKIEGAAYPSISEYARSPGTP
ncbi:glycosyltransferase family 4 protein [Croceibacterium mercuriale]|uniref:glycosyltransferase family 4 protein n=1 Tax=Croceibacterium mercuriale TaxID=1572751 RepID=UPI0009DFE877|nr:glycosyltransferase family 4 protein [Croceibacterium mercuriale]